jgi:hypothetical protein
MHKSEDTSETVAHLREEIHELTQEQSRALEEAMFVPLSETQKKAYAKRRTRLLNLLGDFVERMRQQLGASW